MRKLFLFTMILIYLLSCSDKETPNAEQAKVEKQANIELVSADRIVTIKTFILSPINNGFPVGLRAKIIGKESNYFVSLRIPPIMAQELGKHEKILITHEWGSWVEIYLHNKKVYSTGIIRANYGRDGSLIEFINNEL